MKCPKCDYTSFDYLRECKKCGEALDDSREFLNLKMGEPTLFVNLKDESPEDTVDPEPSILKESMVTDSSPSPLLDSSQPDDSEIFTTSSNITTEEEPIHEKPAVNISPGLGTLGSMESVKPHSYEKNAIDDLPKIELESPTNEISGLELTPSFNHAESTLIDDKQEIETSLFADGDEEKTDMGDLLQEDIPFEFSTNDLENDIELKLTDENDDKDLIELELDMEDEESLDQILADLQSDNKLQK